MKKCILGDYLMFTGQYDILGVYVEQVTTPKRPIIVESLVQSLVKSTFSTRYAENGGLPVKIFFRTLMINDQQAILYNIGKFDGHWKKKIFWAFHQCTP